MSTDDADTVADGEPLDEEEQRELIRLAKKLGIEEPEQRATEVSRRGVMGALGAAGVAGLAGFSTGRARGQQSQATGTIGNGNRDADLLDVTAQSLSTGETSYTELGSTPSSPASGNRLVYAKSDGLYQLDSTGTESTLGQVAGTDLGTL